MCCRKLKCGGEEFDWDLVRKIVVYSEYTQLSEVYKLKQRTHVDLTPWLIMNVGLACGILSKSFVEGIAAYENMRNEKTPNKPVSHAKFKKYVLLCNNFFDAFNDSYPYYQLDDPRIQSLDDILEFLCDWERESAEGITSKAEFISQETFYDMNQTIKGVKEFISHYLGKPHGFPFLIVKFLCQDLVENVFGYLRQSCGGDSNPGYKTMSESFVSFVGKQV